MATLYNSDLKPLDSGEYTHYYDHATKLFLADNYRLAPKQKFLYYVRIQIDQNSVQDILPGFGGNDPASSQSLIEQYETGLLAKRVELPRFNIQTRTLKAYNRKNIVQTGIQYDPINITFHDDAADTVTKFWNDFYTYYYRDSDYDPQLYSVDHKYVPRPRAGWGFSPRNKAKRPFLRYIQIFSLHNKRFTEYMLINPIISAWRHGEHDSSASNELLDSTMTVEFETVKYRTGYVNPVDVNGFAVIHYDNTPSPISNSVTNIYTDAGLVGLLQEGSNDLNRPDGSGSGAGILGSVLDAYRFYNNLKDANFNQLGQIVLGQIGAQVLGGVINGAAQQVFFPTVGSTPGYGDTYASNKTFNQPNLTGSNFYSQSTRTNQATINNQPAAYNPGSGVNYSTQNNLVNNYTKGVITNEAVPTNPLSTALYRVVNNNPNITVSAQTGQPETSEYTAFVLDSTGGETVQSEFVTAGTQSGTYDPTNRQLNVQYVTLDTDQNGQRLITYQYRDNTIVQFNEDGQEIWTSPGTTTDPRNINSNPQNARDLVRQGATLNPTQPQYYTDPVTGVTRVVNGGTPGLIRNTLSGAAAGITGLAVGSQLYGGLKDTFGGGLIGSTVAAGISGVAGTAVGVGVNNLVQSGLNYFLGTPGQAFNPTTGKVQNIAGSTIGTGAFTSENPSRNIRTQVNNGDGTKTVYTNDGGSSVVNIADNSIVSSIKGQFSTWSNWLGSLGQNQDSSILLQSPGTGIQTDSLGIPLFSGAAQSNEGTLDAWMRYDAANNYINEVGPSWQNYYQSETSADFAFLQPEFDLGV
jgi:hypothetical protein